MVRDTTPPDRLQPLRLHARKWVQGGLLAGCLVLGTTANAALSFVFDYNDNAGTSEFLGASNQYRRTALETAGSLFSNYFGSVFSNSGTITLGVQGTNEDCSNGCTLAFAATNFIYNTQGFGNGEVVRNKILGGVDINGAANDGLVGVNWGAAWETNPNTSVAMQAIGNFDFYAALFHEFTHALGFFSQQQQDGSDGSSRGNQSGGIDYAGYWTKFDEFKTDCAGTDLIDHATGLTSPAYANASTSAMCFAGPNALAANGGTAVPLYAPNPYEPGSSGSHLLEQGPNTGAMMKYDRNADVDEARTYNPIEIAILKDLGYTTVNRVPEPGSLALVLTALWGLTLRRRKA